MFPYLPWLRALICRKHTADQIQAACTVRSLAPPTREELVKIAQGLSPAPRTWTPLHDPTDVHFVRWLRNEHLTVFWESEKIPLFAKVDQLHANHRVRNAFQQIYLVRNDISRAISEISTVYPAHLIPPLEVFKLYVETFFDLRSLTIDELHAWANRDSDELQKRQGGGPSIVEAIQGNIPSAYRNAGVPLHFDDKDVLERIINLGVYGIEHLQKTGGITTTEGAMAYGALARTLQSAMQERRTKDPSNIDALKAVQEQLGKIGMRRTNEAQRSKSISFDDLMKQQEKEVQDAPQRKTATRGTTAK